MQTKERIVDHELVEIIDRERKRAREDALLDARVKAPLDAFVAYLKAREQWLEQFRRCEPLIPEELHAAMVNELFQTRDFSPGEDYLAKVRHHMKLVSTDSRHDESRDKYVARVQVCVYGNGETDEEAQQRAAYRILRGMPRLSFPERT